MFENLSDREKKLLLAIGALVPIAIVFLGFLSMQSAYNTNLDQIQSLELQIVEQREIGEKGALAEQRQAYYADTSLPPDITKASNNYLRDIRALMAKESKLAVTFVKPTGGSKIQSGGNVIGQSKQIKASASGTLAQFNDFLTKFYQLDMLHRITDFSLKPQNDPKSKNKLTRNGKITVKITFEVLSLKTGLNRDSFAEFRTHLADSNKDYTDILRRDIFGPKNSEPVVTAGRKTHMTGKEFSTLITATDANKNDMLTFELVESSVEGATLTQTKPGEKRARFKMPDVKPGTYEFGIKAIDDGYPPKSSIKELVVTVNAPKPKKEEEVKTSKPPPEEVDYIQLVKVTGITSDRNGTRHVWVSLGPPTGEFLQLTEGETFEVGKKDKKKYKVEKIYDDEATFSGNDKTYYARPDFKHRGKLKTEEEMRTDEVETNRLQN